MYLEPSLLLLNSQEPPLKANALLNQRFNVGTQCSKIWIRSKNCLSCWTFMMTSVSRRGTPCVYEGWPSALNSCRRWEGLLRLRSLTSVSTCMMCVNASDYTWPTVVAKTSWSHCERKELSKAKKTVTHLLLVFPESLEEVLEREPLLQQDPHFACINSGFWANG